MSEALISNLNEMPLNLIENARNLGTEYEAETYLERHVTSENCKYLRTFVRRVITNGEEVRTWNKGRALIAYSSLSDQLNKEKEALFGYNTAEFMTIVRPNFEAWNSGSDLGGMFVFCEPEADYRSQTPPGYGIMSLKEADLITIDSNMISIQFRRWLASRMAAYLKAKNELHTFKNSELLEEVAAKEQWTEDALIAFKGLTKERAACNWNDEVIPGFCGTDSFYQNYDSEK